MSEKLRVNSLGKIVSRKGLSLRDREPWLAPRIIKAVTWINWELRIRNWELGTGNASNVSGSRVILPDL